MVQGEISGPIGWVSDWFVWSVQMGIGLFSRRDAPPMTQIALRVFG